MLNIKALLVFSALALSTALASADCGVPESWDAEGVTVVSEKDLSKRMRPLTASEEAQLIALARDLVRQNEEPITIDSAARARIYFMQAFRDELYIDKIRFENRDYTLIYGWPGDNRGGSVFQGDTLTIVGDVNEDGLFCVPPRTLQ